MSKIAQLFWVVRMGIQTHTTNSRCNFLPPAPGSISNLACWQQSKLVCPCPWTTGAISEAYRLGCDWVCSNTPAWMRPWVPFQHSQKKRKKVPKHKVSPSCRSSQKGFSDSSKALQYQLRASGHGFIYMFSHSNLSQNESSSTYWNNSKEKEEELL